MPARRPKRRAQPYVPLDVERLMHGVARVERRASGEWHVQPMSAGSAVKVPGVVVVLSALIGGTLLGILGALVAIPVAAAIQLILKEVVIPRQDAK